jgi:hypothetical protein
MSVALIYSVGRQDGYGKDLQGNEPDITDILSLHLPGGTA